MKEYLKPIIEVIDFATEVITKQEIVSGEDDGGL